MPQLIVSDVKLPQIDGIEVLRWFEASDRAKIMPQAILTSSQHKLNSSNSYPPACNSYICKKIDSIEVNETVNNLGLYWLIFNQQPHKTRRS